MTNYIWKGQTVELVPGQQFDTHWNIYYNEPTENGGSIKKIVCVNPKDITSGNAPQNNVRSIVTEPSSGVSEAQTININEVSFLDLRKAFPGLGRASCKTISDNKPYRNFEELQSKNSSLNVNWDILKGSLVYE
jgi:hypothetical protein